MSNFCLLSPISFSFQIQRVDENFIHPDEIENEIGLTAFLYRLVLTKCLRNFIFIFIQLEWLNNPIRGEY